MKEILAVGLGGALGSMARYMIKLVAIQIGLSTSLGTLAVNAIGSFAIGVCLSVLSDKILSLIVVIGFLGGFTTFSTFSAEAVTFLRQGETFKALAYVAVTLTTCLLFTYLGMKLGIRNR